MRRAFTLMELMVCVVILLMLGAMAFVSFNKVQEQNQAQPQKVYVVPFKPVMLGAMAFVSFNKVQEQNQAQPQKVYVEPTRLKITIASKFESNGVFYITDTRGVTLCIAPNGGKGAAMYGPLEVGKTYRIGVVRVDWDVNMEIVEITPTEAEKTPTSP
jgi:prepilin-type N-terminal cleavage/methylation domain-containing protein